MTTFSPTPTYYQVTWTNNSPTDYSSLTGTQAGGLDSISSASYNKTISTTGTIAITTTLLGAGDTIVINGYTITFAAADVMNDIIRKINAWSHLTDVVADQRIETTYLTLANAPGYEGQGFYIQEGNSDVLEDLGLTPGEYKKYPTMVGSAYSTVGTGDNVTINGYNLVFTTGAVASAASQLNAVTAYTGITAAVAAARLQLSSASGSQPWAINSGNAVAKLGLTTGNQIGFGPATLAQSQANELGNMRWRQVINELERFSTPSFVGNVAISGNFIGNVTPTTFSFTVGYDHPDQVITVGRTTEPDTGTTFIGELAVKRAVARAMSSSMNSNRMVFDPILTTYGSYTAQVYSPKIQNLTAAGIDTVTNIVTIENNISVVQISGI